MIIQHKPLHSVDKNKFAYSIAIAALLLWQQVSANTGAPLQNRVILSVGRTAITCNNLEPGTRFFNYLTQKKE